MNRRRFDHLPFLRIARAVRAALEWARREDIDPLIVGCWSVAVVYLCAALEKAL